MVRVKLMEAVLLLWRGLSPGPASTGGSVLRFHAEEAKRYIEEHCSEPLTLSQLAGRYGLNPSYFSRLFHQEAGVPVVESINRARIQKGCQLLKRSQATIVEIALAVGYNNLSHFNRYFRRIVGMSPREYRQASGK